MIAQYGADSVRLYILYMGPAEDDIEWQDTGIEGMARFLGRLWRLGLEAAERGPVDVPADGVLVRRAHEAIAKVGDDITRRFQFNTPIAAVIELVNEIYHVKDDPDRAGEVRFATETAVSLIQPYAPHLAEELWERLGASACRTRPGPRQTVTARTGHVRAGRAGERAGAGQGRGAGRSLRARAGRTREGIRACAPTWTARRSARRSSSRASSSTWSSKTTLPTLSS